MIVLERKRDGMGILLAPLPILAILLLYVRELDIPFLISSALIVIVFLIAIAMLLKSSKKPAAWVENDVLTIRGKWGSNTLIHLKEVDDMRYITGETLKVRGGDIKRDALIVKMKGFSDWEIPITDDLEHLSERRLYMFIKENFYDLPYLECGDNTV